MRCPGRPILTLLLLACGVAFAQDQDEKNKPPPDPFAAAGAKPGNWENGAYPGAGARYSESLALLKRRLDESPADIEAPALPEGHPIGALRAADWLVAQGAVDEALAVLNTARGSYDDAQEQQAGLRVLRLTGGHIGDAPDPYGFLPVPPVRVAVPQAGATDEAPDPAPEGP